MTDQQDKAKTEKLQERAGKLAEQTQAGRRKALQRRINRASRRLKTLLSAEGEEAQQKNAPAIEELRKRIADLREDMKKIWSEVGREKRTQLRRTQRHILEVRYRTLSLEERRKGLQKLADLIGKKSQELQKTITKGQVNAYDHSYRKKMKSLNKRIKKLGRLIERAKEKNPPAEGESQA